MNNGLSTSVSNVSSVPIDMQSNPFSSSLPKTRVKTPEKVSLQKRVALLQAQKSAVVPRNPDVVRPRRQLDVDIFLATLDRKKGLSVKALIDSGCTIDADVCFDIVKHSS